MILTIKTDNPVAELGLMQGNKKVDDYTWEAGRELARDLIKQIQVFLHKNNVDFAGLTGLVIYNGPGSFTGLRIGITVADTIAYGQQIPIVGVTGEDWQQIGVTKLVSGQNDKIVLPHYGAEANITPPRK